MLDCSTQRPAGGPAAAHHTVRLQGLQVDWLARGPVHLAAADDVQVQVVDGLAAVGPVVDHHTVALAQTLLLGHLGSRGAAAHAGMIKDDAPRVELGYCSCVLWSPASSSAASSSRLLAAGALDVACR